MSLFSVNGNAVVEGMLTLPLAGRWVADLELEGPPPALGSQVELRAPGLSLSGHVARVGAFVGQNTVRMVAGRGGLPATLPAQSYRSMPVALLLEDILGAIGERLSSTVAPSILERTLLSWVRPAGLASAALAELCKILDCTWRVLADGTVWLGVDTWRTSPARGELLEASALSRAIQVAFEDASVLPGTTWGGFRVEVVTHAITGTGFRTTIATP